MTTPPVCPSCQLVIEYESWLQEGSPDILDARVFGHERCSQPKIKRLLKTFLNPPAVKVIDPIIAKRGKNNRRRGRTAEKAWAALILKIMDRTTVEAPEPVVRGILGGADVTWDFLPGYAFEVKQRQGGWPSTTVLRKAEAQAAKNAGARMPVVVACKTTSNSREFRVGELSGAEWIAALLTEVI